jgi:hypothetical protein
MLSLRVLTIAPLGLVLACGGDNPDENSAGADTAASGFTGGGSDGPDASAGTEGSSGSGSSSGYDTLGEGDMRGILTFTLYPVDAGNPEPIVGMAGAWRTADHELTDLDDFFAAYGLQLFFPLPPEDADTLVDNGIAPPFGWGAPTDWLQAGNAMKLDSTDATAQACLLYLASPPMVEFPPGSGTEVPNYPVYAATHSELQPEGCTPDPSLWIGDHDYDLVLYGGDRFETNALVGQVRTPAELTVESPDIATLNLEIDQGSDLEITWTGEGDAATRLILRLWDATLHTITINAADDGSYTIPAAALAELDPGPVTLSVARERVEIVPFTEGTIKVITRYDQWGYLDLIEATH